MQKDKVAVINSDRDTIAGLTLALTDAGYQVVSMCATGATAEDIHAFVSDMQPRVIVYDIGPPYTESVRHWSDLCASPAARDRPFVLTTTGRGVEIGRMGQTRTEMIEKPTGFDAIVTAVARVLKGAG